MFKCIFCGSTKLTFFEDHTRCSNCSHSYPTVNSIPILVKDWNLLEKKIEEAKASKPSWYEKAQPAETASPWRHHLKKRRTFVEKSIRGFLQGREKSENILDLGCGDGNNISWLKHLSDRCFGSDYNPVRLSRAKDRYPDTSFFLADILDYPVTDSFFEIIFFNHVIEHIPDDNRALKEVFRLLKPGGLLVLGTPNEGCGWWQHAYRQSPEVLQQTDHVNFYTATTIGTKVIQAGFKLIETKHMGWGPPNWELDGQLRQYKVLDDLFEILGRVFAPRQASSLYLLATKT